MDIRFVLITVAVVAVAAILGWLLRRFRVRPQWRLAYWGLIVSGLIFFWVTGFPVNHLVMPMIAKGRDGGSDDCHIVEGRLTTALHGRGHRFESCRVRQ